ncbi:MAG: PH domain-containing protein [Syntrophomonadaceae bacterium]
MVDADLKKGVVQMAQIEKLVESARSYLEPGETVISSVMGTYEAKGTIKNGVFLATDRRLVFYSKKLTGYDMEVFPYSSIGSMEMGKDFMGHRIAFFASGNKVTMKWINAGNVPDFIQAVNRGINGESFNFNQNETTTITDQEDVNATLTNPIISSNADTSVKQVKKPIWKKWWFWGIIVVILVALFSGDDNSNTSTKDVPASKNASPTEVVKTYSLGITPDEFKANFNSAAAKVDADFKIDNLELKSGEIQDVYQSMLTENIGLLITANKKDGSVRDVTLIAQGDGTFKSGADIIIAIGTLITAFHPESTPDERGQVLKDLGLFKEGTDILNLKGNTTRGKYKYWINSSPTIGIMFGVQDKNDE